MSNSGYGIEKNEYCDESSPLNQFLCMEKQNEKLKMK